MKWLLCTHHLFGWGGSELVVIELAEELSRRGYMVSIYSPFADVDFIEQALGDGQPLLHDPEDVELSQFDVVYSQHQTISRTLPFQPDTFPFEGRRPVFIYNHLSPFEPFEFPGPFVERELADIILANSWETAERIREFGPQFSGVRLFQNPAPRQYERMNETPAAELKRLLAVSNHMPAELASALEILTAKYGVEVTRLGLPGLSRRVTPDDLAQHDAVVTIGKTTQYALRSGVPVYVYDRFGGPGWLSEMTWAAAMATNFSGRSELTIRDPATLVAELREGYGAAALAASAPGWSMDPFKLETAVDWLVRKAAAARARPRTIGLSDRLTVRKALRRQWAHEADLYMLVDQQFAAIYPQVSKILARRL